MVPSQLTLESVLDDGNPRPKCNVTDDCWIWMVARCQKMGGDGLCVMTSCSDDGYCFGLCPPKEENVTSSSTSATTGRRCKFMELPPRKTKTEASTLTDDFEKTKWRPGMPRPSGRDPVEMSPTFFLPGQEPTSSQAITPDPFTSTLTGDTTLATSTRGLASSWEGGMSHML